MDVLPMKTVVLMKFVLVVNV
ncbi:hypothetical protein KUTeg_010519 [Tegillarca granosa]|uniref:Uncharacterized protein n=1 Tax=Tegillarca granosa TaxID=220873 RepID=A0ABQ9F6L6_TEGGR|nr:hypothetical protein KUTeg_010519 [Tegillarca granosa]